MQKYNRKIIKNVVWETEKKKTEDIGMLLYFHRLNKQQQNASNNSVNHYYERAPTTINPNVLGSLNVPRLCNNIVDANKLLKCSLI